MKLSMENSQFPLATDSFSYSWLINSKPSSFDGLLESLRSSLDISRADADADDTIPIFDFNVHPPGGVSSRFSISLVHADELFSDGCIRPVFINLDRQKSSVPASPICSSLPGSSSMADSREGTGNQGLDYNLGNAKCKKKAPGQVLQGCYGLLRPICQGFGCSRTNVRVDDLDRKVMEVKSRSNSVQASPDRRRSKLESNKIMDALVKETSYRNWTSNSVQASPERRNKRAVLKKSRSSACDQSLMASPAARSPAHCSSTDASESSIREAILHCKRSFAN